jgi:hypothetical protein
LDEEFVSVSPDTKLFLRDEDTKKIYEKPVEVQKFGDTKSTYLVHNPIIGDPEPILNL